MQRLRWMWAKGPLHFYYVLRNSIYRPIRNVLYWLPIIWNDKPWDYWYLLAIWKHKIEQMEAATVDWLHADAEDIAKEMRDTIYLISDLMEDRHENLAAERHEEIFGKPMRVFEPDPDGLGVEMITTYPDAEDQETAREGLLAFMRIADLSRKITMAALSRSIYRIERWWD